MEPGNIEPILVLALVLLAAPAFAQGGSTTSPSTPNAASAMPEPVGSVPAGSLTGGATNQTGVTISTTTVRVLPNSTQGMTTPALPSALTGPTGSPSGAMNRTISPPGK